MAAQNKENVDTEAMPSDPGADQKERLIAAVKKEVKQLMEEAVTKKLIHEDSGGVTTLCGAVEACLGQGLRRRALGLFKTNSTTALLHKIAKHCPEAALVSARVLAAEGAPATRSASGVERRPSVPRPPLCKRGSGSLLQQPAPQPKYLWIRIALFERQLAKIIEHLVSNAARYYERDALVADPDYGTILSSLLVGPCALEYSKVKTPAVFWTDPPADELVQRHRMSAGTTTPPSVRRPILNFRRSLNTSSDEGGATASGVSGAGVVSNAKDYVESLHQNSRATLLYGKNNVRVQPKDVEEPMPGYLSLHQTAAGLVIKWTPNQLMNGYAESEGVDKSQRFVRHLVHSSVCINKSSMPCPAPECTVFRRNCEGPLCIDCVYWAMSLQVCVPEIVYVHVHRGRSADALILVGQDGVQRPPIHFPKGGHLLSFLSSLETGLLPHGQLDPPLWSQRGTGKVFGRGKGRRRPMPSLCESGEEGEDGEWEETAGDYVFRIVNNAIADREVMKHSLLDRVLNSPPRTPRRPLASTSTTSSDSSTMSVDCPSSAGPNGQHTALPAQTLAEQVNILKSASIELVCSTMRRQIISRAFYGWLAYCRHLSTVRTHLSGLVHPNIVPRDGAENGLTEETWRTMTDGSGAVHDKDEVYRLVYYGGVQHDIRKEVWPYLLEYYEFGSTAEQRAEQDAAYRRQYETTMSEWLCVEAIVKQRDKEATAASIARLSEASGRLQPTAIDPNEVFEDNCSMISDDPPVVSPEPSECERRADAKPVLSRAPSIDEVDNIEMDADCRINGETDHNENTGDNRDVDGLQDLAEDEDDVHVTSAVVNPDMRRESIAEIKRLAEGIVQKGDGRGPLCSVDSANMNGNEMRSSLDETPQPSPHQQHTSVIVTNPSVDLAASGSPVSGNGTANVSPSRNPLGMVREESHSATASFDALEPAPDTARGSDTRSNCVSPASSNGGVYSNELVENFALNLHRIEKDVQRCDRNYPFFTHENLDKLRNIMCTYVWEHLETGYMQGMCDLVAPLLVIMREEASAHALFTRLMERAKHNFPSGQAMDAHFADMRSLIQILDCELYELMHAHGDYTHFYFCYRWFLLDFKRELLYQDVFAAWELTWAARQVASEHMVLFIALALLETYRDVILANTMDFTDIIKFFNEMAERHDAAAILSLARDLVLQVQTLIENK